MVRTTVLSLDSESSAMLAVEGYEWHIRVALSKGPHRPIRERGWRLGVVEFLCLSMDIEYEDLDKSFHFRICGSCLEDSTLNFNLMG